MPCLLFRPLRHTVRGDSFHGPPTHRIHAPAPLRRRTAGRFPPNGPATGAEVSLSRRPGRPRRRGVRPERLGPAMLTHESAGSEHDEKVRTRRHVPGPPPDPVRIRRAQAEFPARSTGNFDGVFFGAGSCLSADFDTPVTGSVAHGNRVCPAPTTRWIRWGGGSIPGSGPRNPARRGISPWVLPRWEGKVEDRPAGGGSRGRRRGSSPR
jgi:hypothetical protein